MLWLTRASICNLTQLTLSTHILTHRNTGIWRWELLARGILAARNIYIFLIKRIATRRKSSVQISSFRTQHMELSGTETGATIRKQRESISQRTWKTGRPGQIKKKLSGEIWVVITQLTAVPWCICEQQLNRYSCFRSAWSVSSAVWYWLNIICFVTSLCPTILPNNAEAAAETYRSRCWILFWLMHH